MKQNTFSVHFVLRNDRVDEEGYAPIYAKITLNGKKLSFTANQRIRVSDWNVKKGMPMPKAENFPTISETIQALQTRIHSAYSKLVAASGEISLEMLKAEISGRKEEQKREHMFIETAEQHNAAFKQLVGVKYSEGSMKNYRCSLKYYKEFVPHFYKKKDIPLSQVNFKFCEAYFIWLTSVKDCKVNGANKQIQRVRKIINYAISQGYIVANPMVGYKLVNTPVTRSALTMQEIERLQNLDLNRETLKMVRDVFVFQCYTGLAYTDIKELRPKDIVTADDGQQ